MKILKIILIIALLFGCDSLWSQNKQKTDINEKGSFGLNINPAYYVLGGYSVRGIYHSQKKWSFGLNIEGGFELPDDFRDAFFNDNQAIDVDWDYLVGLETRYRFDNENYDKGFYASASIGFEGWTVNETDTNAAQSFDNWFSSLGIGYNWYPFKTKNFNVGLSYNIIFILNNTDDQTVGNTTFSIEGVIPPSFIPSNIHIGWRF